MTVSTTQLNAETNTWDAHLQTLHAQFYAQAKDQCVLWIDPAQIDPFAEDERVQTRKVVVPIKHPRFDLATAPYLVVLDLSTSQDADVFKTSVQIAWEDWESDNLFSMGGQTVSGWVMTDAPVKSLAQHWANHCYLHRVNALTKLLRFHDPSVREWLWPTLNATQQAQLLGPAKKIIAIDRQQQLMTHEATRADAQQAPAVSQSSSKLHLSAAQWRAVNDYATLHMAWLNLLSDHLAFRKSISQQPSWVQTALAALNQATEYGVTDKGSRELFARHVLELGNDFHIDRQLQPVWDKTKSGDYYANALETVFKQDPNQLHQILHENNKKD